MWTKLDKPHENFKSASSTATLKPFATFTDGYGFLQAIRDDNCVVLFVSSPHGYKATPWFPPEVGVAIWSQQETARPKKRPFDIAVHVGASDLVNLGKSESLRALYNCLHAWMVENAGGSGSVACGVLKAFNDPANDGNGHVEIDLKFPLLEEVTDGSRS